MREVAVIGIGQTRVEEQWNKSLRELAGDAALAALHNSGLDRVQAVYVGNMMSGSANMHQHLGGYIADWIGMRYAASLRLEAACSTGAAWFRSAVMAVAYGRVNDCLIYGQETNLTVRCKDDEITQMLKDIPFSKNKDIYGIPFQELFARCGNNWAFVPRAWDAPCKINFFNVTTGNAYSTGEIGYAPLEKAFLGDGGELL